MISYMNYTFIVIKTDLSLIRLNLSKNYELKRSLVSIGIYIEYVNMRIT